MAKRTGTPSDRVSSPAPDLPYRPVLDWPTSFFVAQVIAHLMATAQPETCELLYRNRIPKDAKFRIVQKIYLDQKKRPEGDRAPCPMCTTNRFLGGALVFLPELRCCAVIGHCCADNESRDAAEREYKTRTKHRHEEDLLLATLPIVSKKAAVLAKLRPAAEEAQRIYRKFRRGVPTVHGHLRELKTRRGGYLVVTELVQGDKADDDIQTHGPMRLGRRGEELTREIEFGAFVGQTAVIKDYNPVKELDNVVRILTSLDATPTEEEALNFIVNMTDAQRHAAVAILESIESHYAKFVTRVRDFALFFTKENIELIHAYGAHKSNPFPIDAKYETINGQPRITFRHWRERCQLLIGRQLHAAHFEWPRP